MQRLYDVYENNRKMVGEFETRGESQRYTLLPTSHVTQSAQIEVILDQDGNFYRAEVVQKDRSSTIVPASLESANRSGSTVAPHYLHDKLFYVAGDYVEFGSNKKRFGNFDKYIAQMKDWVMSEYSHPKAEIIYRYVSQKTIISDLIEANILFEQHDKLLEKWPSRDERPDIYKVVTGDCSEAFVRFNILAKSPIDRVVWEDQSLFEAFQKYYISSKEEQSDGKGICYVTGETVFLTNRHGSRIRNAGDMSKLISSNDNRNFTYRGRFTVPEHAVQIGYDVSQKAHNALRWLIQRQGYRADDRSFITFGVKQTNIAQPFDSTNDILEDSLPFLSSNELFSNDGDNTRLVIAEQVEQALKGRKYNIDIGKNDQIIIMAVDAATRGRMSIVYYQELDSSIFLESLKHWHSTCIWTHNYYDAEKKLCQYNGVPSTYYIVEAVYGPRADARLKKQLYTRLLPCIIDRMPIPKDIVKTIFNRVRNPMSFEVTELTKPTGDWQRTLNIACSLINKLYEKEELNMALDEERNDRDYLFGRLLGVAEVIERNELRIRKEDRATNAMRYFTAFSQNPARTWLTIRKQLHPYQVRRGEKVSYYNRLIRGIEERIHPEQMNNEALGPLFLLGYSSQINRLYQKNEKEEGVKNDSN